MQCPKQAILRSTAGPGIPCGTESVAAPRFGNPDGPGKEDFVTMCGQCHGVSTAIAVRRSSDGWHGLIQDMRSRGAQGDDAKANRVHDYLSRYFGFLPEQQTPVAYPR